MSADWDRIKTLFAAAVDLPADARTALLDRDCADPEVRIEVESLLRAHDRSSGFLHSPPAPPLEPDDLVGGLVGPYRIVRRVGAGGMGMVYEAVRADATYEKTVAIKVVKRGLDTDEILRRFQRERQALARLYHPNIARIFDGGTTRDGRPYLVMDYVAGQHIDHYCQEHRLSIGDRLRLFRTVCAAVQHAHQHLVIHRDLKPDNILVTADGVPVLVDFGVAKALEPDDDELPVTRPAERRLTLAYASPEQVRGEPTATVSDVYSLGVILYELLSGRRPYRRALNTPADYELALSEGPMRPSEEQPAAIARQLAGDLDTIVLRAMHPEPARRYVSAGQLAEDIDRHLAGLPVMARPDTVGYRTRKFVNRHRAAMAAAAAALLALTAGLAGTLWQYRAARLERDRAQAAAARAEQITAFLSSTLSAAAPDEEGRDVTVVQAMDRAAARAGAELADAPIALAAIRTTIGETYLQLGALDKAVPQLEEALAIRRKTLPPADPGVVDALDQLASAYDERGDLDRAEATYREALDLATRNWGAGSVRVGMLSGNLGVVVRHEGRTAEAVPLLRRAVDAARRGTGTPAGDASLAERLNDLAVALGTLERWQEALPLHQEALAIIERVRGPRHSEMPAALGAVATALAALGRPDEAEPYYLRAIALRVDLTGNDSPATAWSRYQYASMLVEHGRPAQAIEQAKLVVAIRGSVPPSYPPISASLLVLGRAYMDLGQPARAEPYLRDSLALRSKSLPPGHWLTAMSQSYLGECLGRLHRFAEAEPLVETGHKTLLAAFGASDSRTREAAARLAAVRGAAGRPGPAPQHP